MANDESFDQRKPLRVPRRLDRLVASGRLTTEEAARLQAGDPAEVDAVLAEVRVRHARAVLDAAVVEGGISRADADDLLDRVRLGEPSADLRARITRLRRSTSTPSASKARGEGRST